MYILYNSRDDEGEPEAKKRRIEVEVQQYGCGDIEEEEEQEEEHEGQSFQIVRPLESNYFSLEVMSTRSFKNLNAVKEITYKSKVEKPPW